MSNDDDAQSEGQSAAASATILDRSTFQWLEHVNINVPNHEFILPFYFELLGFGLDPRRAQNVALGSKTIWANCGGSQFHLPYGDTPQVIPGKIGLRYSSLHGLKQRLEKEPSQDKEYFQEYTIGKDAQSQNEYIRIVDHYGNVFLCREGPEINPRFQQPLVSTEDAESVGEETATKYGRSASECRGIDYVEFRCPPKTAAKIAQFYDSVFDATTSVVESNEEQVALIAFGPIDENGRAQQYLLFREASPQQPLPPYDGHHVALYVGYNQADFEQAFANAKLAGVVWVNKRFRDDVTDINGARKYQQFRFKDIIDVATGKVIMELEHEMRCINHSAWPGPKHNENNDT